MIINLLKNNDCNLVTNIYYNFPSETKHVTITLTADDLGGKTISKQDFIDMYVSSNRTTIKSEIGKNGVVDANVEYDGTNIIIKTVLTLITMISKTFRQKTSKTLSYHR